jgi:hypothetical protein
VNTPNIVADPDAKCLDPREVRIFNIKTGEILRLNATFEELTIIVVELLRGKYENTAPKTNEEFLRDCEAYMNEYVGKYHLGKEDEPEDDYDGEDEEEQREYDY